jgi:hypothetical protein
MDVNFFGLTNAQAKPADVHVDDEVLRFTGTIGAWDPPPRVSCAGGVPGPPAKGDSGFSITPQGMSPLTGTLALTITGAQLAGSCIPSGSDDSTLSLSFRTLQIVCPDIGSNIKVTVDLKSAFTKIINGAVNKPDILKKILDAINTEIANRLGDISTQVTAYAREAINNGLK